MGELIKVGMADLKVAKYPDMLTTLGLGSCIGIALYDRQKGIIGLAHIMLPEKPQNKDAEVNVAKYADTAILFLVQEMEDLGAKKRNLVAKLAGGAKMFLSNQFSDVMKIGEKNITASIEKLTELNISIVAQDVGGNKGRTIELLSSDGTLIIKSLGTVIKEI